ncbi:hypothetical protein ACHAWF_008552 [Thalassiosira exigua]
MVTSYVNPGGPGPKTRTTTRSVTNPDGTRTITTTTEVTATTAFKEETTKKVDVKHLPSLPRVRRDQVKLDDGTTGYRKTTTVVHPGGQREIAVEHPDGTKESKVVEGKDKSETKKKEGGDATVVEAFRTPEVVRPGWGAHPWDSALRRLEVHAGSTPHKTAIAFLKASSSSDCAPAISSSTTYGKFHAAVEYLAGRLLPPADVPGGGQEGLDPKKALVPPRKDGRSPLKKGDRVLLVYPPCAPHFIVGFLACLRAGLVAVPVYPPHPDRKDSVGAFVGIARGCGAKVALTNGEYAQAKRLGKLKGAFGAKAKLRGNAGGEAPPPTWPEELVWVVTDREPLQNPPDTFVKRGSMPDPHEPAFIQYTSGSTSAPKGVTLTHANLAHNLYAIVDELKADEETKVVSWLPQYHDMGLIGSLLGVLYCGGSGYYMSPIAFLQRPAGWIEAVSEHRGTHLQAPNFAFGLAARKFDEKRYCKGTGGTTVDEGGKAVRPLDLSCVKHAVNGAEPVTEKSIAAFEKAFAPFGLKEGVIYPTYGLAEHTVFVCSGGKGKLSVKKKELEEDNKVVVVENGGGEGTIGFLGCGFPLHQNIDVRVVDPARRVALPDGTVGEIWINSPSKAEGYWGKSDEETRADFRAVLDNMKETSEKFGGYLRSGDLGFLHEEQLYICGRIKDLIIVGGRNHYPQDIEATAEDAAAEFVRPGCSAAFSIGSKSGDLGDYEEVVLAMELKEPPPDASKLEGVADMVRSEIFKEHSLALSCVVLVKARTMPKTTSGKIQRSRAQQGFRGKTLQEVYRKEYPTGDVSDFGPTQAQGENQKRPEPNPQKQLTPAQIRAMDKPAIREMLLDCIAGLAHVSKSSIKDDVPLNTLMDSVTLAQLKGILEGRYGVKPMSDPYMFNDSTTVKKLVEVVKVGEARDDTGEGATSTPSSGAPGCCGCVVM